MTTALWATGRGRKLGQSDQVRTLQRRLVKEDEALNAEEAAEATPLDNNLEPERFYDAPSDFETDDPDLIDWESDPLDTKRCFQR